MRPTLLANWDGRVRIRGNRRRGTPQKLKKGRAMMLRGLALLLIGISLGGCMQGTIEAASEANFTARDRKLLANAPYAKASIPAAYQRTIVQYHRKEAPGS